MFDVFAERVVELGALVAGPVVGDDPFDHDPERRVERGRSSPEPRGGGALFVGEDLAVRDAGVAIDRGMHERVADLRPLRLPAAMRAPAAAFGDPAQFLDVDVDELTGPGHDHPPDRRPCRPVEVIETVELMADQHAMHRRSMLTDDPRDPRRPLPGRDPQPDDASLHRRLRPVRAVVRSTRTVLEPRETFGLEASPPHIRAVAEMPIDAAACATGQPAAMRSQSRSRPSGVKGALRCTRSLRCEWVAWQLHTRPEASSIRGPRQQRPWALHLGPQQDGRCTKRKGQDSKKRLRKLGQSVRTSELGRRS